MSVNPHNDMNYESMSREELIALLKDRENPRVKPERTKRARLQRPFEMDLYPIRPVALKIAYLGWNYQGFASQIGSRFDESCLPERRDGDRKVADTVEDHLFGALIRTRLISDVKSAKYSRCGRTDAGVSSTGQVVSLCLRSSNRKITELKNDDSEVINFIAALNKQLPKDIRVLDWAFIPEDFSARFSCTARLYHYYFPVIFFDNLKRTWSHLNIEKMQEAAALLVGTHDFRNFCKRDPSKPLQTFVRHVYETSIEKVDAEFYRLVIKGSAFLYHQVRCIMAVLFMIGRGGEPVELVTTLLTRLSLKEGLPEVPNGPLVHYEIASDVPLTLHTCFYDNHDLKWNSQQAQSTTAASNDSALMNHFYSMWHDMYSQARILKLLLNPAAIPESESPKPSGIYEKLLEITKDAN